ncbi:hypothetical protein LGQ03_03730 [Loktanella sp. TSTF-M6]|uniref:Phosphoadenosine phosphosulfate reductase n=1 Tax=Loktanella gaetbuli TaxID=2881335 RepID=A0ABS8BRH7_9RHOB|nr:hypothetical protein [Loktanella gaetbuli]MCB5198340.1 hypothetical protein [Loktanella gaetbuli]
MTDHRLTFETDLKGLEIDDWLVALEELVEDHGSYTPLGDDFGAAFLDAGPKLLVTFENATEVMSLPDAAPRGFAFARREGWSHLAIISRGESWFRDERVYRHFDRLIDDGFFEDFEDVLFYGAQAGGYAAAAFAVAAPGARVLALRPQATLDPAVAGWDMRFVKYRGQNFTRRYGYAPDMIDAAQRAYIAYCPQQRMDAMHAALFTKPNVSMLRVSGLGGRMDVMFEALRVLDDVIRAAMDGTLTHARFGQLMRARKQSGAYLRNLHKRLLDTGHDALAVQLCYAVLARGPNPFFAKQLQEMGKPLPKSAKAEFDAV